RGLPQAARAWAGELSARIGRARTPWAALVRRRRLANRGLRGSRSLRDAGRRLPRLRSRGAARADRSAPGARARPAREPLRRRGDARALRPRARDGRGPGRRPERGRGGITWVDAGARRRTGACLGLDQAPALTARIRARG